jgi:hypothetical protein
MSAHQRSTLSACLRLPRAVALGAAMLLGTAGALVPAPASANPGLVVSDLNQTGVTPTSLANALVGSGVTVSAVTYTGANRAAGAFSGGATIIGFDTGIILDSGKVQTYPPDPACSRGVEGPNTCHELGGPAGVSNSTAFGTPGDAQLTALSGFPTFDASILEFDFMPTFSTVQFQYVFSSEEYSDFSNTEFNDVFAFFVNGTNCALTPDGKPVSVNTINNGNDVGGDPTSHNAALFRDNVRPTPTIETQMDGLTTVLTCTATVNAGVNNHMKLAIADASDAIFDSAVFLKGGSLKSGTQVATSLSGGGLTGGAITVPQGTAVTDSATLSGANAASAGGTVSYNIYSDAACSAFVQTAGTKMVTLGVVPNSDPVTMNVAGTFYWQAAYSGDATTGNNASTSVCGSETVTVITTEQPISATGTNVSATEGALFTGTAATFTDPTTTATAAEYMASIKWGDGHTSAGIVSGPTGGLFTVTGSNIFAEEGPYTVTVTITDIDDTTNGATTTSTATVSDAALSASCAVVSTSAQSFSGPTATFTDAASPFGTLSDFSASINWGDGTTSAGTVTGPNGGPYSVGGSHTYASTGPFTITTTISDVGGSSTSTPGCTGLVFGFAPGGGAFVIGDGNSANGTPVTFWGANWWKLNSLSGGSAPASFKGFAEAPATPACGTGWNTDTGNSTPPPAGPLPAFMGVIVSSSATQSGSTDSGDTVHIVVVQTDPGYHPNPGHPGTGTVVAQVC